MLGGTIHVLPGQKKTGVSCKLDHNKFLPVKWQSKLVVGSRVDETHVPRNSFTSVRGGGIFVSSR